MANFELHDNDNFETTHRVNNKKNKKSLTSKFIDWGLAKNENQAELIMVAIVIIGFGLIIFINLNTYGDSDGAYTEEIYE